jgi:Domain of unknown function (DUF5615)
VKLLFDENLSPRLVAALADVYAASAHVHECGLGSADDIAIWQYAKDNDFTIVSKDSDLLAVTVVRVHLCQPLDGILVLAEQAAFPCHLKATVPCGRIYGNTPPS